MRGLPFTPFHNRPKASEWPRRFWRPISRRDGTAYRDTSELAYEMVITDAGRALYEAEWARYREMYPDIETPPPPGA